MKKICIVLIITLLVFLFVSCDQDQSVLNNYSFNNLISKTMSYNTIVNYNKSVYFLQEYKIYRATDSTNTPEEIKTTMDVMTLLFSDSNLILYKCEDGLYKIGVDGTNEQKICSNNVKSATILDGWIYYSYGTPIEDYPYIEYSPLYKVKADGTGNTQLTDSPVKNVTAYKDSIYFIDTDNDNLYEYNEDLKAKWFWESFEDFDSYIIYEDFIYYINAKDNFLYRIKWLDDRSIQSIADNDSDREKLCNLYCDYKFIIKDSQIYFMGSQDEYSRPYKNYSMDMNGNELNEVLYK